MLVLIGIIAGLFILLVVGTWLNNRFNKKNDGKQKESKNAIALDCCGAHEVCDFEEMLNNPDEIVYFEDEELDQYKGVDANNYQDEQIEEFREVLYTLDSEEIRKWLLSIERRRIQLPSVLKQEAIQLLAEA